MSIEKIMDVQFEITTDEDGDVQFYIADMQYTVTLNPIVASVFARRLGAAAEPGCLALAVALTGPSTPVR